MSTRFQPNEFHEKFELFVRFYGNKEWQKACTNTSKTQCDMLRASI